jgi:predicted secreted protein
MNILKRNFIKLVASAGVLSSMPIFLLAKNNTSLEKNTKLLNEQISKIANGRAIITNTQAISINVKNINKNGLMVLIEVSIKYPMESNNQISSIHILSNANEQVKIADITFSEYNTQAYFSTRIKIEQTSSIVVLAQTSTNKIAKATTNIKVQEAI